MLHISIKAETLFSLWGFPITNSILASWVLLVIFLVFSLYFARNFDKKKSTLVFFVLFMVNGLYSMYQSILKENTKKFFPLLASFFLYILLSNWLGLLPGVGSVTYKTAEPEVAHIEVEKIVETDAREEVVEDNHGVVEDKAVEKEGIETQTHTNEEVHETPPIPILRAATADLNMTLALGVIAFILIQYYGIAFVGFAGYAKKFLNFSNPISFFTGILEIISEFSKIISFAFRLFGNIFAGEVLLAVVAFLVPVLASFPFLLLEIFVGFIQGLVFSMLFAVFLSMAIAKHH